MWPTFNVNVADEDSVAAALEGVKARFGDIHICCNYAGVGTPGRTLGRDGALPLAHFKRVVDINLVGTFNVLRLVAEQMATHDPGHGGRLPWCDHQYRLCRCL